MAQIVCIIGNKGGTGKTTLSHMIAHGMGLLGKQSVCVLTDLERDRLSKEGRRYLPFDARSADNLDKVVRTLNHVPDWYGVIDGGGNRPDMDEKLAAIADLVILPFRDSHEDLRTVAKDLKRFPQAYALPSQWPTNPWAREAADRTVEVMLAPWRDRVLEPITALSATKQLLQDQIPGRLPAALNSACRLLAMQVFELWGIGFESVQDDLVHPALLGRSTSALMPATASRGS